MAMPTPAPAGGDMMSPQAAGSPGDAMPAQQAQAPTLENISAAYDKLMEATKKMARIRSGLDGLVALGDTISTEDVVKSAGKMVAAGMTPEGMATVLADMPEKPEQLMEWIGQHDADVRKREADLSAMTKQVRHQLGTMAMGQLAQQGRMDQLSQAMSAVSAAGANGSMPSGGAGAMGLGAPQEE